MLHNKVGDQKLFKVFGHFSRLVLLSLLASSLSAASFANFKRTQSTQFKNYKEENDRIFTSYLKSDWQAYYFNESLHTYKEKKPQELFPAKNTVVKKQGPRISIEVEKNENKREVQTLDKVKIHLVEKKDIQIDFFGTEIDFNIPEGMEEAKYTSATKEGISACYSNLALSSYEVLLQKIKNISLELNLNDWGKYILVNRMSESIFTNQDESRLLSWFLFNKLGYAVRVGLSNRHIVVMYHSEKVIYATPNYNINRKKFYILSSNAKENMQRVFTYKQNYPDANKSLDLSMESLPKFFKNIKEKTLSFRQYGKTYTIKYNYNQNLIDFMSTYPQADYETYFNAPLDATTYKEIALELKKYINAKQASVGLNFVLNFVQTAFIYEVDLRQFGKEKVMFAEETLYYSKSDCEDRAILFSYLVKELFHIGVVGVKYKDHMSTALYIPMQGDGVQVYSKKFIIADPTYVNASIGQSMPKYKKLKPESFIRVK